MKFLLAVIKEPKGAVKYIALAFLLFTLFIIGFVNPSNNQVTAKKALPSNMQTLGGEIYSVFRAGTLVWMADDLRLEIQGSWCYGGRTNCKTRLYTMSAASKACWALGFRLASIEEWENLAFYIGSSGANRPKSYSSTYVYRALTENFNIKFSGKGMVYSNGSTDFSDSGEHGYYIAADNKYFDFNPATKTVSRQTVEGPLLFSCRCVKEQ